MLIVCPYVEGKLQAETLTALTMHAPKLVEFVKLDADDAYAYGKLIEDLWANQEDFALVEQDIVIRPDVVNAFLQCQYFYCAFPYAWSTNIGPALGCTRFRRTLMHAYPNTAKEATASGTTWKQLDVVFMRRVLAGKYKVQPHVHVPPVEHLNEEKKLLPEADPAPMLSVPADIGNLL